MITENINKDLNELCMKCSNLVVDKDRNFSKLDDFIENLDQTILMLQSISNKHRNIDLEAGILSNYTLLNLYTSEKSLDTFERRFVKYSDNFNVISNSLFPRDKFSKKVKVTMWTYYFHCLQTLWLILNDKIEKAKSLLHDLELFEIKENKDNDFNFVTTKLGFVNQSIVHVNIYDDLMSLKATLTTLIHFLHKKYSKCLDSLKDSCVSVKWKTIGGLCYYEKGEFSKCINYLKEISTLDDDASDKVKYFILILLGNCCVKMNNWVQAMCFWFNALQISAHPTVLYNFSCYYYFKKEKEKELEMLDLLYNQSLESDKQFFAKEERNVDYLIYSKLNVTIPDIDSFNYKSPIGISYIIASKYFDLGKYEEAAEYLCKLFGHIEEHSDEYQLQEGICLATAKLWLIHCLIECNELEEALEICNSMLDDENERDTDDYFGDNFNDDVVKDRNNIIAEYYKAVIYFAMKKNIKALKAFDRVIESLIDLISNKNPIDEVKNISYLFSYERDSLEFILSKSYNFVGYLHYLNGDKEHSVNCFRSGSIASSKDKSIGNNYLFLLKETNKIDELYKNSQQETPEKILEPKL